ncbi:probable transmembrane reductase CYB561D1 isoform X2 [Chiloscyllium plagiosum]|uniref:probable transmembrane reductase CYB561D1 isoform X2 n=1 Tax=Chiloscyllium plagiosum TaxID=36176 RepID=UPI001CB7DE03|nr:probable transmembrane reductase CYB561D1 isoform X2 [Chiloscyllium plagiosum]
MNGCRLPDTQGPLPESPDPPQTRTTAPPRASPSLRARPRSQQPRPLGRFSWHPACMTTAVCFCMTEAILTFSLDSSPFFFCSIKAKVRIHWMMQVFAAIFGSVGLIFIVSSKNISESLHLTSWHSFLGLGTLIAVCGQLLCGLFLLFPQLINTYSVARLRLYHATCGLVTYLMATATVVLGLCSDWFKSQVNGVLWYICLIVPVIPALVIMNQINNGYLSKKKIEI